MGLNEVPHEAWSAGPVVSAGRWSRYCAGPSPFVTGSVPGQDPVVPTSPLRVWRLIPCITQDRTEGQEPLLQLSTLWPAQFSHRAGSPAGGKGWGPVKHRQTNRPMPGGGEEERSGDRRGFLMEPPACLWFPGLRGALSPALQPTPPPGRTPSTDPCQSPLHLRSTN